MTQQVHIQQSDGDLVIQPDHVPVNPGSTLEFIADVPVVVTFASGSLAANRFATNNQVTVNTSPVSVQLSQELFDAANNQFFQVVSTTVLRPGANRPSTAQGELHPPSGGGPGN